MKRETRIDMVERAFKLLDNKDTTRVDDIYLSPVASYTCKDWLALEEDILFKNYPLLAAFSCDLPKAGDFITNDDTGVPLLLVRDKDGAINAFYNTCRHRGAKLAKGCGRILKGV